jgi:hypothetical protein
MLIGIDPGNVVQSFVIFDGNRVVSTGNVSVEELCVILRENPDLLAACEYIDFMGMAVGSEVFATVFNVGRLYSAATIMRLIPRRDIKLHLCGSHRAKDANVRQALIDKVGPVGNKKAPGPCYGVATHLWSALAVAVTATDCEVTKNEVIPT